MQKFNLKNILANAKNKNVLINIVGAFIIKGGALVVSLFSTPIYIRFFQNKEILGVWLTLLSVMTWILSFDFGIGQGLRNKLVEKLNPFDQNQVKALISSAYIIFGAISLAILLIGFFICPLINWNSVLNISIDTVDLKSLTLAVQLVFVSIMLQFFLKLVNSILYAIQKSMINNLLTLITSLSILFVTLIVKPADSISALKTLAFLYIFCVNLPLLVANVVVFSTKFRKCLPNFKFLKKEETKSVLGIGGVFFWNQIVFMLITVTNEFLISKVFSPEFTVTYSIYYKIFMLLGTVATLALTPLWSAVTKAMVEKDFIWIKRILFIVFIGSAILIIFEVALIFGCQFVFDLWLQEETIKADTITAIAFASYGSLFIFQSGISTIACGLGRLKNQFIFYLVGLGIKIALCIILTIISNNWIVVIFASAMAFLPYCVIEPISLVKHLNKMSMAEKELKISQ